MWLILHKLEESINKLIEKEEVFHVDEEADDYVLPQTTKPSPIFTIAVMGDPTISV